MPKSVFHRLFILNGYSQFTALSLDFATDQQLGSTLNGFVSQYQPSVIFFWPILVHLRPNDVLNDSVK